METKHTPEPWRGGGCCVYDANGRLVGDLSEACVYGHTPDQVEANTNHIVSCVNALAGLNPEAVRDAVEALKSLLQYEGVVVEYMGALGNVDAEQKTTKQFTTARDALAKLEDVK